MLGKEIGFLAVNLKIKTVHAYTHVHIYLLTTALCSICAVYQELRCRKVRI